MVRSNPFITRRSFLNVATAGAGAALFGCAPRGAESGLPLIRVAVTPRTSMSGLYLAIERGYFTDLGLEVVPHAFTRTPQIIPLLASGRMDAALVSINVAFLNAVAQGAKVVLAAGRTTVGGECGNTTRLYGNADSFPDGLADLSVLRGKKVSIRGPQTFTEFALDYMLDSAGLSAEDVEMAYLSQEDGVAALYSRRIDALLTSYIEADLPSMSEKFIYGPSVSNLMPNQQRSFIALGPTMLEQDIGVGASFLQGLLLGIQQFEQGETPEYFDELATAEGMDPEQARTLCRDRMVEDGVIDTASVQQYIDWAVRREYCPDPPSLDQLIDSRFVKLVQERLAAGAGQGAR